MREFKGNSIIALPTEYVIIDTETTGLDYDYCNLIEICAVRFSDGIQSGIFSTLVQPPKYEVYDDVANVWMEKYVDNYITELTGITNEMLASAPTPTSVIPAFLEFIGNSVLIGHNINFDINFLYDAAEKNCGVFLRNDFIDTLRIARKLYPELKHHRLSDIAGICHVPQSQAHRAEADCVVTAQCYEYMRNAILANQAVEEFQSRFKRNYKQYSDTLSSIVATVDDIDNTNPLFEKTVVFTGALSTTERKNAFQIVANLGGIPKDSITKKTNYLVIGNSDFAASVKNGKTTKMKQAEAYQQKGCEITIISENAFFEMISEYITD